MATDIHIPYSKEITANRSLDDVWTYFSDPSKCLKENFPGLESMNALPDGSYQWNFKPLSHSGYSLQIQFCTILKPKPKELIEVLPSGNTNTRLNGKISINGNGSSTTIGLKWDLVVSAPIPGFLKGMVTPIAQRELTKLFDKFAENVTRSLASG